MKKGSFKKTAGVLILGLLMTGLAVGCGGSSDSDDDIEGDPIEQPVNPTDPTDPEEPVPPTLSATELIAQYCYCHVDVPLFNPENFTHPDRELDLTPTVEELRVIDRYLRQ